MTQKVLALFIALGVGFAAQSASAEGFVSVRAGAAFTQKDSNPTVGSRGAFGEADFDDSVTGGVRGGYWIDAFDYLGVALDISAFATDLDSVTSAITPAGTTATTFLTSDFDIVATPLSLLALARFPFLRSEKHPHGQVQPYVGIGPGLFVTAARYDALDYNGVGVDVGLDVVGGVSYKFNKLIGLFVEYRFTRYEGKLEGDADNIRVNDLEFEFDLHTHHVTVGVGFHF